MPRYAFTMIEILVTITIIMVLVGMLLGGFTVVSRRVHRTAAETQVTQIHQACLVYRGEDKKRRFPPGVAEGVLYIELPDRDRTWDGATPLAGMMLARVGLSVHGEHADPQSNGRLALIDAWGQPLRYHVDDVADGTIDRPQDAAGQPVRVPDDVTNWNPRSEDPYAYVWSWGRPRSGHDLREQATDWIYVRETPR